MAAASTSQGTDTMKEGKGKSSGQDDDSTFTVHVLFPDDPFERPNQTVTLKLPNEITIPDFRQRMVSGAVQGLEGVAEDALRMVHKGRAFVLAKRDAKLKEFLLEGNNPLDHPIYCFINPQVWRNPPEKWVKAQEERRRAAVARLNKEASGVPCTPPSPSTTLPPMTSPGTLAHSLMDTEPAYFGTPSMQAAPASQAPHASQASQPALQTDATSANATPPTIQKIGADLIQTYSKFDASTDTRAIWGAHWAFAAALDLSQRTALLVTLRTLADYLTYRFLAEARSLQMSISPQEHVQTPVQFQANVPSMEGKARALVDMLKLQSIVDSFQDQAEKDANDPARDSGKEAIPHEHSRTIDICGQPFLLHVPSQFSEYHMNRKALFHSFRTHQAYLSIVRSLISFLELPQNTAGPTGIAMPSRPAVQRVRPAPRHAVTEPGAVPQQPMHQPLQQHGPMADPRFNPNGQLQQNVAPNNAVRVNGVARANAVAIVINLDELRKTLLPLFWLSIKLSFMLYIFGRHASQPKRIVMGIMALGWIIWEAYGLRSRRAAEGRRQMQAIAQGQGQVREVPANHGQPLPQPVPQPQQMPPNGAGAQRPILNNNNLRPGVIFQRAPRPDAAAPVPADPQAGNGQVQHRRSRHRSIWSTSYFINKLAAAGLAPEARAMGIGELTRRKAALTLRLQGQPVPERREREREDITKTWTFTLLVLFMLFFGTLIPEVERRRRRAIEKRDRILKQLTQEVADLEKRLAELPAPGPVAAASGGNSSAINAAASVDESNTDALDDRLRHLAEEDSRAPSPAPHQGDGPLPVPQPLNGDQQLENEQLEGQLEDLPRENDDGENPDRDDEVGL